MKKTLREAIEHLYHTGTEKQFKTDGLPSVTAVRKLIGRSVSKDEIHEMWRSLYGYSTYRASMRPD